MSREPTMTVRSARLRNTLLVFGMAGACHVAFGCGGAADRPGPNVVFIIIDDLGWTDTGVYGSTFYETPNIDRLASEGVRFTDFYTASSVCSPTRASLMTGKHPARVRITNWIGGEQHGRLVQAEYERQLALDEVTIGDAFREAGYATGYVGKWHLGDAPYYPEHQGFDVNVAGHAAGQPGSYFHPYENERLPWSDVPGLEGGAEGEYLTDRLTDEAVRFIASHRDTSFLLVLSHYAVHTPLQSKDALARRYEAKAAALPAPTGPAFAPEHEWGTTKQRQDHAVYAGMIRSTDESIGRIMQALDSLGLDDHTAVVFVSDNGGLSTLATGRTTMPTSNLPLRAGKGWLYEGGIRSPLIVKWPGVAPEGAVTEVPAISTDLYPTLLAMAGLDPRPRQHRDGLDLTPLLRGDGAVQRETLYWHFPHYHGSGNRPSGALRHGDYKLIEWLEDGRVELYDLRRDVGETRDLAGEIPQRAAELRDRLHAWRVEVGAAMPRPNPEWRPQ